MMMLRLCGGGVHRLCCMRLRSAMQQHQSSPAVVALGVIRDKLNTLQMTVRHAEESLEHLPEPLMMQHIQDIHRAVNIPQCSIDIFAGMFCKGKCYVYVLKLENECVYVGFTENLTERLNAHFTSKGAAWTRLHRPVEVMQVLEGDKDLERDRTLHMMRVHGWEKVRGATWCKVDMKQPPSELLAINGINGSSTRS